MPPGPKQTLLPGNTITVADSSTGNAGDPVAEGEVIKAKLEALDMTPAVRTSDGKPVDGAAAQVQIAAAVIGNDVDNDASADEHKDGVDEMVVAQFKPAEDAAEPVPASWQVRASGESWLDDNLKLMDVADKLALFNYFKLHQQMVGIKHAA
jgi:hypothetical protein